MELFSDFWIDQPCAAFSGHNLKVTQESLLMRAVDAPTSYPARAGHLAFSSGLRGLLKDATADAHRALDARLGGFDRSKLPGYRRFLEANAAALLPLEASLVDAGVAEVFADWERRSRRGAILADLAVVDGKARPLTAPQPFNRNHMLGIMYVLEGSRIGAQFLLGRITNSPDPRVAAATAYLGHGAGERLWQSFLVRLDSQPADIEEAIEGARNAFAMFAEAAARA